LKPCGKKFKIVPFQSHALCQQERLQAQEWILGKDNKSVTSSLSFSEIPCPLLRALHHCLVKKVMYHSGATFKEALKQVTFFKIKQNLQENVPWEAAFNCVAAKLKKFI